MSLRCRRLKGQIELAFSYSDLFLSYLLNVMVIDICVEPCKGSHMHYVLMNISKARNHEYGSRKCSVGQDYMYDLITILQPPQTGLVWLLRASNILTQ